MEALNKKDEDDVNRVEKSRDAERKKNL